MTWPLTEDAPAQNERGGFSGEIESPIYGDSKQGRD
jgi:hypothetical protein